MAVSEQTPYSEHTGNGITTSFALGFKCKEKAHLIVKLNDENASVNTWTLSSDTVVFSTAPTSGTKIFLQRKTPNRRTADYKSFNNSFNPTALNEDLDTLWLRLQEEDVSKFLLNQLINMNYEDLDKKGQDIRSELINRLTEKTNQLNDQIIQQGVSQNQLQNYYSFLLNQMANLSSNKNWLASLIADASGKNQQEINNNTAFFYQTMAEMLADKKLADGVVVATKGYHNISDDGGAVYLISSTATDYSIPLDNGLHAIFRDTFDIRKFGIRDNATLDQTEELRRMVAYADSRFYEIDFHNFSIMTPNITHFTTPRGSVVKGLGFHYPHHLKNIKPANDKSKTLQQGTCQILFLPKSKGSGVFKFSNAEFDSYVPNFNIISGEYDGMMCGFMVMPHPDWADFNILEESGYDFDVTDIRFKSPAISYNISLAGIQASQTRLSRLTGEYWGLYVNIFTKILDADDSVAVFRDDLHNGSGRLLVTNFIHEEPEITGATVVQEKYSIKNCKCFKKSNGAPYTVYKLHALAKTTIKEFNFINCVGILDFYTALDSLTQQSIIQTLNISDIDQLQVSLRSTIGTLNLKNVKETASFIVNNNYIGIINITGGIKLTIPLGIASGVVESLNVDSVDVIDQTYGLVRSTVITIDNINIGKLTLNSNKLIECKFKTIDIAAFDLQFDGDLNNAILCRNASVNPSVKIRNFSSLSSNLQYFMLFDPAHIGSVTFLNCMFLNAPQVENGSIQYVMSSVSATKAFTPPSINGGASAITTLALAGVKIGDIINANFSQFNSNIIVSAYVDTPDIVKVELKNISNNTIGLASGTLSIKLV